MIRNWNGLDQTQSRSVLKASKASKNIINSFRNLPTYSVQQLGGADKFWALMGFKRDLGGNSHVNPPNLLVTTAYISTTLTA